MSGELREEIDCGHSCMWFPVLLWYRACW